MLEFLNLRTEAFGLDISDLSLKLVKLKRKKRGLALSSFTEIKMRPGIVEEGEIRKDSS